MYTINRFSPFIKAALLVLGVFWCGCTSAGPGAREGQQENIVPAHHDGGKFRNPHLASGSRWWDFWRWRLGLGPREEPAVPEAARLPYRPEVLTPDQNTLNHADPRTIQVTWLGHATFLIQVAGLNILTDPMFSQRASPVSFAGPIRVAPLPLTPQELPPIHLAIISHNHYDHLDVSSVKQLGPRVTFVVPLGLAAWFQRLGLPQVRELDWWQTTAFGPLRLHCVPAQHFSLRSPFDAYRTLWAGWVLETPVGRIYFAGDTGYSPDFREIGRRLGPMRLAFLPIGGYKPRWFMRPMHLDPAEAVQVHREVRSQQSIGMHWGTFKLTEEPLAEPPLYLQRVLQAQQLPPEEFLVLRLGETRVFAGSGAACGPDGSPAAAR